MASIPVDKEVYAVLQVLLERFAPIAVRTYFDKLFPPPDLHLTIQKNYKILRDLKFEVLNLDQWNRLFPKKGMFVRLHIGRYIKVTSVLLCMLCVIHFSPMPKVLTLLFLGEKN